jgi:hypothetical protein
MADAQSDLGYVHLDIAGQNQAARAVHLPDRVLTVFVLLNLML